MPLESEYIILRALEYDDMEPLREMRNNIKDRHNFRTWSEISSHKQESYYWKEIVNSKDHLVFAIVEKETGTFIGEVGATFIDSTNRSGEMRLILHEDYRGKGYGTDALKMFVDYAINYANLHRLVAIALEENVPSVHTFESVGFEIEGILKDYKMYDQKYHNAVQLSYVAGVN